MRTEPQTELVPDMLIIVQDAAYDFDALFGLFAFFFFELIGGLFLRLDTHIGVEHDADVVDDFFEELLNGLEVVDAFGLLEFVLEFVYLCGVHFGELLVLLV
jgi:hypothetical protein